MGKLIVDFDDYTPQQYDEYDGDEPRPGWYTFELQKVAWYGEDQETIRWIFVIADGPYAGWAGFVYSNMDTTKWKTQETVRALQGGKESKVALDLDNDKAVAAFIKKAKRVRGKVENQKNRETEELRLSLRKVRPLLEEAGNKPSAPADDLDDLDDTAVDGTDEAADDLEPYTEEELGEMKLPALKAILKDEFDFSAADLRAIKRQQDAIDAILEAQGDDEDDADQDADEDDDFDEDADTDEEPEPEPEPEPAPRRRRSATATKAAPAKAAAPAQRTRRTRRG